MAHVTLPEGAPGILGLLQSYPETAQHLHGFTEALMRGPSSLSIVDRETIGAYVSLGNGCTFCARAHAAVARELAGREVRIVEAALADAGAPTIPERLRALLAIAEKVRQGGRRVSAEDIARARAAGADDKAIHDTVLIAATFALFNRYVDGLDTWAPSDPDIYQQIGKMLAGQGYVSAVPLDGGRGEADAGSPRGDDDTALPPV